MIFSQIFFIFILLLSFSQILPLDLYHFVLIHHISIFQCNLTNHRIMPLFLTFWNLKPTWRKIICFGLYVRASFLLHNLIRWSKIVLWARTFSFIFLNQMYTSWGLSFMIKAFLVDFHQINGFIFSFLLEYFCLYLFLIAITISFADWWHNFLWLFLSHIFYIFIQPLLLSLFSLVLAHIDGDL